jgi:hypothetical protein
MAITLLFLAEGHGSITVTLHAPYWVVAILSAAMGTVVYSQLERLWEPSLREVRSSD